MIDDGMARLVIGRRQLLFLRHGHGLALGAHHDLVFGILELGLRHETLVAPRREQSRFVDEVRQIGARKSGRTAGNDFRIDVRRQRHLLHMDAQDFLAAKHVRVRHHDLAVETAGTQQGGIEHVGTVRRRDDDDALVGFEAIHLDEQLIERLLALIVTAAQTGAAMTSDGIDFVDEDDARRVLLRLLEHVAHAAGADADEHFDEVRARDREERHVGFARDGARDQRFARAGRTDEQAATRDAAAEALEFLRVAQEFDDLFEIGFRFIDARNVLERHATMPLGQEFSARLAEAHGAPGSRLHLAHEKDPDADEQQHRKPAQENARNRLHFVLCRPGFELYALFAQTRHEIGIFRRVSRECRVIGRSIPLRACDAVARQHGLRYGPFIDGIEKFRILNLVRMPRLAGVADKII